MHHLATNLQLLRARAKYTQAIVAYAVCIKRSSYSGYENGTSEPDIDTLVKLAAYHKLSIHRLLVQDMRHLAEYQQGAIDRGYDERAWYDRMLNVKPL